MRRAELSRKTAETDIKLSLDLDGTGTSEISTGCGFLDHMLTLFARHGRFDLTVACQGDTYVDDHHTVEDIGICLGDAFARALGDKRGIVRTNPDHVVLIDEAYIDFGGESCLPLIHKYDNLLVCQTFSKFRSLAGGRLGYALAGEGLIADLEKIKYSTNSYNINRLTMAAAVATLDSNEYYVENSKKIQANRAYTVAELDKLGFETLPSVTNFIFTRCPAIDGGTLYRKLKARGVLVRHWDKPEIAGWCRVTIGTREQMDIFLDKVREIVKEAG